MKVKSVLKLIASLIILFLLYNESELFFPQEVVELVNADSGVEYDLQEQIFSDVELEFCPSAECYDIYANSFREAKQEIKCAFYEFDLENLSSVLEKSVENGVSVKLVIDNDYLDEEGFLKIRNNSKVQIKSDIGNSKYMHDKFCVIDSQVLLTGSANPTLNGFYKNNNNIIKIYSSYLSKNYENEFDQLFDQHFGYTKKSVLEYNNVKLNFEGEEYLMSSYFCPQDNCPLHVMDVLNSAQDEILFAHFSFTYDDFSKILVEKANQGLNVTGVFESRMRNVQGGEYELLNSSASVFVDVNPNTMHHKLFVVDERYVVTGSMNPSNNAAKYNDENILVIDSPRLARLYKQEIERLIV